MRRPPPACNPKFGVSRQSCLQVSKSIPSLATLFIGVILCSALASGQAFTISTAAGSGGFGYYGDGGPAISAQLNLPQSVAVDAAGNLYIADSLNNVIREVTPNGNITTVAGNGTAGYSGDGGPATSAQLSLPYGVAVDRAGDLFIADTANDVIREVTPDGNITTVAGTNTRGFAGDGGPANAAQLYGPYAVAVDAAGDLYISDSGNHAIREVLAGGNIVTLAGNGEPGYSGDGGSAVSGRFYYPRGLALDPAGNLYIADFGNNVIRKISTSGTVTTFAGNGQLGYSGDGGPATSATLNYPEGLAVDAAGNVYVADTLNQAIREISKNGVIATIAGNGTIGFLGNGGPATSAQLFYPKGLAVTSAGQIYIADWDNDEIRLLTPSTSAHDERSRTTIH
jgi:sugar lactone lactonase YvrE